MQNDESTSNNLPQRSDLWIVANIAVIITLVDSIIVLIEPIFYKFLPQDIILFTICFGLIFLFDLWLSSKIGVWCVVRRFKIDADKIGIISKLTAFITPILFLWVAEIENGFRKNYSSDIFFLLLVLLFLALPIYYFVRKFLKHAVARNNS